MQADGFSFEITHRCGRARRGRLQTPHGLIDTPAFMPVGTRACVKSLTPVQVASTGAQIVLANTYHLLLRPGPDVVRQLGGLHRFSGWDGPVLTDSGGFQVFSLADLRQIDDAGVTFRSHIDGALIHMTPESSIATQNALGADIIMAFDECPALPSAPADLDRAVRRTIAWGRRSREAHSRSDQALYGIIQGGLERDVRLRCQDQLVDIGFDGYALGGLSVGEPPAEMWSFLEDFAHRMPESHPRYLMGVGTPRDLIEAVCAGIDQFDCVMPTRNGRKGYAFTHHGVVRIRNAAHRLSDAPLDRLCDCSTCTTFSRGYLRHLIHVGEPLGATLISLHNLAFYQSLMRALRAAIESNDLAQVRHDWLNRFERGDNEESE